MSVNKNKNGDETGNFFESYLDSLPAKEHTEAEQEKLIRNILWLSSPSVAEKRNTENRNLFDSISDKIKKLFSSPVGGSRIPILHPAIVTAFVIIVISTIAFLFIDNSSEQKSIPISYSEKATYKADSKTEKAPSDNSKEEIVQADETVKQEQKQIGFIQLRISNRAFTDSKNDVFVEDSKLIRNIFSISSEILSEYGINISMENSKKIVTGWFYYKSNIDNSIYKSRLIIRFVNNNNPGISFAEERNIAQTTNSSTMLNIDLKQILKEIKSKYYNNKK